MAIIESEIFADGVSNTTALHAGKRNCEACGVTLLYPDLTEALSGDWDERLHGKFVCSLCMQFSELDLLKRVFGRSRPAPDLRPRCILCTCRWLPPEGVDATVTACPACETPDCTCKPVFDSSKRIIGATGRSRCPHHHNATCTCPPVPMHCTRAAYDPAELLTRVDRPAPLHVRLNWEVKARQCPTHGKALYPPEQQDPAPAAERRGVIYGSTSDDIASCAACGKARKPDSRNWAVDAQTGRAADGTTHDAAVVCEKCWMGMRADRILGIKERRAAKLYPVKVEVGFTDKATPDLARVGKALDAAIITSLMNMIREGRPTHRGGCQCCVCLLASNPQHDEWTQAELGRRLAFYGACAGEFNWLRAFHERCRTAADARGM